MLQMVAEPWQLESIQRELSRDEGFLEGEQNSRDPWAG